MPIIGADFLSHYHLAPYLAEHRLIDMRTKQSAACSPTTTRSYGLSTVNKLVNNEILSKYPLLIRKFNPVETPKHSVTHRIEIIGRPVNCRARQLAPDKLRIAKTQFDELCKLGICRISQGSPFASPLHMVKKTNGEWRICGDYRQLNLITKPDCYPIPLITDCTAYLHGTTIFNTIDLVKAYYQVPVEKDDVCKTAVKTPFGLYEFMRMPFGLRNAPQTFQRFVDQLTRDLDFAFVYLDDILVASKTKAEHEKHLHVLLTRLAEKGLSINLQKCIFYASQVKFLGYTISAQGIAPLLDRVQSIVIQDFYMSHLFKVQTTMTIFI